MLWLAGVLFPVQGSEQSNDGLLDSLLDESELLVTLTAEDLSEESDVVVFLLEGLDAVDYRGRPLNNQVLQPISLVQVRIHELFHSLPW